MPAYAYWTASEPKYALCKYTNMRDGYFETGGVVEGGLIPGTPQNQLYPISDWHMLQ